MATDLLTRTDIPADVDAVFNNIQCECQHRDGQCTRTARVCIIYHCMGRCTRPQFQPDGETTEFLCMHCFETFAFHVVQSIVQLVVHSLLFGQPAECSSCHKPTHQPHDIIREVRPL